MYASTPFSLGRGDDNVVAPTVVVIALSNSPGVLASPEGGWVLREHAVEAYRRSFAPADRKIRVREVDRTWGLGEWKSPLRA